MDRLGQSYNIRDSFLTFAQVCSAWMRIGQVLYCETLTYSGNKLHQILLTTWCGRKACILFPVWAPHVSSYSICDTNTFVHFRWKRWPLINPVDVVDLQARRIWRPLRGQLLLCLHLWTYQLDHSPTAYCTKEIHPCTITIANGCILHCLHGTMVERLTSLMVSEYQWIITIWSPVLATSRNCRFFKLFVGTRPVVDRKVLSNLQRGLKFLAGSDIQAD